MNKSNTFNKLYNAELKERFISQQDSIATRKVYKTVLSNCFKFENFLNKDVCRFTIEELQNLFGSFNAKSLNSIRYKVSIINNYIEFAIDQGYSDDRINYYFKDESVLDGFVNKIGRESKYITKQQLLEDIVGEMENMQDAITFVLMFEGIKSLDEISDIIMTEDDFKDMKVTTTTKTRTRKVPLSKEAVAVLLDANEETDYLKNNGMFVETPLYPEAELETTRYLLKPTKEKNRVCVKCSGGRARQRFDKMKKLLEYPHLTPITIWESGIIDMAKTMSEELTISECIMLNEKYNIVDTQIVHAEVDNKNIYKIRLKVKKLKKYISSK